MNEAFSVFVVDDDPFVLDALRGILESDYVVETFPSAVACQDRLATQKPGMFLLDVRMPEIDGYTFCREIKDHVALRQIPVTFVSSHDTIEARLKGYDAGGEDFIVKPFVSEEVLRKVQVAHQIATEKSSMRQQLEESELLSSLVMSNMDEYAVLVPFLRDLAGLKTEHEISAGLLDLLRRFRLDGVVQTRISGRTLTVSAQGTDLPLETSIVDHLRSMGRLFEFRNRSVFNYKSLSLMVNNMPLQDPEFCGRLRDHLCIAAECVDARLKASEIEESERCNQAAIREAVTQISASSNRARQTHLRNSTACGELLLSLEMDFSRAFAHIGMSENDESSLSKLLHNFNDRMLKLLDSGEESQRAMEDLGRRLQQLNTGTDH